MTNHVMTTEDVKAFFDGVTLWKDGRVSNFRSVFITPNGVLTHREFALFYDPKNRVFPMGSGETTRDPIDAFLFAGMPRVILTELGEEHL